MENKTAEALKKGTEESMEEIAMVFESNGKPLTTSRFVAEQFEKQHNNILRDIDGIISDLNQTEAGAEFSTLNFIPTTYQDTQGREQPMYLLTRQGFSLLAMGFTGTKALYFKIAYINAFDRMESIIKKGISSDRLEMLERRLNALESATSAGKEDAEGTIADTFLQAIKTALDSGEYCLIPKRIKDRRGEPTAEILGLYDEELIILKSQTAYSIYKDRADNPLSIQFLWQVLEHTGTIRKRRGRTERLVGDKRCATICLFTEKGKALVSDLLEQTDTRAYNKPTE